MPKRRYKNLKNLMYEQEITQQQLSKITGIPLSTLRRRFAGHEPWDFRIMDGQVLAKPAAKLLGGRLFYIPCSIREYIFNILT